MYFEQFSCGGSNETYQTIVAESCPRGARSTTVQNYKGQTHPPRLGDRRKSAPA